MLIDTDKLTPEQVLRLYLMGFCTALDYRHARGRAAMLEYLEMGRSEEEAEMALETAAKNAFVPSRKEWGLPEQSRLWRKFCIAGSALQNLGNLGEEDSGAEYMPRWFAEVIDDQEDLITALVGEIDKDCDFVDVRLESDTPRTYTRADAIKSLKRVVDYYREQMSRFCGHDVVE